MSPFSASDVPAVTLVRRRTLGLFATLGTAALLAGCGGSGDEPKVDTKPVAAKQADSGEEAKEVVRQYLAAFLAGDGEAACNLLTEKTVAEVVDNGEERTADESFAICVDTIGGLGEFLDDEERAHLENPKLTAEQVDGDTAVVALEPDGTKVTLTHTDEYGWLIADGIDS